MDESAFVPNAHVDETFWYESHEIDIFTSVSIVLFNFLNVL